MGMLLAATLFGSIAWLVVFTSVLVTLLFVSEGLGNGFLAFWASVVYVGFILLWGSIDPGLYGFLLGWEAPAAYLLAGLVFATVRTFVHGMVCKKEFLESYSGPYERDGELSQAEREKHRQESSDDARNSMVDELKGNVSRWWFIWPVSLVYWVLTDLMKDMWDWLYLRIGRIYRRVAESGFDSVKEKSHETR